MRARESAEHTVLAIYRTAVAIGKVVVNLTNIRCIPKETSSIFRTLAKKRYGTVCVYATLTTHSGGAWTIAWPA